MYVIESKEGLQFMDFIVYPDIKIEEGYFAFMAGNSGCGKSTYLKILNRTIVSTGSSIYYRGTAIEKLPVLPYRKKILLVPQEVFLFDGTVQDNFNLYYDAREKIRLSEQKILYFLHICCIDVILTTKCKRLSGGEKQRVFLAIYLSCVPDVLLLDEPTAALDEHTSTKLLSNIKHFCKQEHITVVCVCHNDDLIQTFSDSIIRLGANS